MKELSLKSCMFILAAIMLTAVCLHAIQPLSVQNTLAQWEKAGQVSGFDDIELLKAWGDAIRQSDIKSDPTISSRLLTIVRSKQHSRASRAEALSVACDVADESGANEILSLLFHPTLDTTIPSDLRNNATQMSEARFQGILVRSAVRDNLQRLISVTNDHTSIFAFLKEHFLSGAGIGSLNNVSELMAACRVGQGLRNDAVLEIIDSHYKKRRGPPPYSLIEILDESAFPSLRERVRSTKSRLGFDMVALSALSHLGDSEILPYLQERRPTFLAESKNYESYLLRHIWRIEVQNPQTNLLDYIASIETPGYRDWRNWAVRRAHTRGIEKTLIRQAILTHEANAATKNERVELPMLKELGFELGILENDDLPGVRTSSPRRRH